MWHKILTKYLLIGLHFKNDNIFSVNFFFFLFEIFIYILYEDYITCAITMRLLILKHNFAYSIMLNISERKRIKKEIFKRSL